MSKRILYTILLVLFLADTGVSFIQHYHEPLDGDMPAHIVPSIHNQHVLDHPFGIEAIKNKESYPNPNRFFCHWSMREYFLLVPGMLHGITDPIHSVYLSSAIIKTIIQVILLMLLATAVTGSLNGRKLEFMLAMVLMAPLFQANGYRSYMGIIDPSPTYFFFYALPTTLLLLYYLPLILKYYHGREIRFNVPLKILWLLMAVILSLSGPLNPGVILIITLLMLWKHAAASFAAEGNGSLIKKAGKSIASIPPDYWLFLMPISLMALYSLYLGKYNSNEMDIQISLGERFSRLPKGIYLSVTQKIGFPVLFISLALNTILIKKHFRHTDGKKISRIFGWIGIFALIYILLLPFGGYRSYRPYLLRYDTIMPVTLSLVFYFGLSSLFLIKNLSRKQKYWYLPILILVLFIFTNGDELKLRNNACEVHALEVIQDSHEKIVPVSSDCVVLSWEKIADPSYSELSAQMLVLWGITEEKKLYYNE